MEKGWALEKSVSSVVESLQRNGGAKQILPWKSWGKTYFEFLDPFGSFGQKARNPQIHPENLLIFCEIFPIFSMKKRWPIFRSQRF